MDLFTNRGANHTRRSLKTSKLNALSWNTSFDSLPYILCSCERDGSFCNQLNEKNLQVFNLRND